MSLQGKPSGAPWGLRGFWGGDRGPQLYLRHALVLLHGHKLVVHAMYQQHGHGQLGVVDLVPLRPVLPAHHGPQDEGGDVEGVSLLQQLLLLGTLAGKAGSAREKGRGLAWGGGRGEAKTLQSGAGPRKKWEPGLPGRRGMVQGHLGPQTDRQGLGGSRGERRPWGDLPPSSPTPEAHLQELQARQGEGGPWNGSCCCHHHLQGSHAGPVGGPVVAGELCPSPSIPVPPGGSLEEAPGQAGREAAQQAGGHVEDGAEAGLQGGGPPSVDHDHFVHQIRVFVGQEGTEGDPETKDTQGGQ